MRFLTMHFALVQAGASLAGGFIGAYLLQNGFSLATALLGYGGYLSVRSLLRFGSLEVVRAVGYRRGLMIGTAVVGLQFVPLMWAAEPAWFAGWLVCVAAGESLYCPLYHAAMAVVGESETRGRQLGWRTTISTLISVTAPLLGAWLMIRFGAVAMFGSAAVATVLAVVPLGFLGAFDAGVVPRAGTALRAVDALAFMTFAADGWISAGLVFAWPMVLFISFGSSYGALGAATAAAGLVAAVASWLCGRGIDRGQRAVYLNGVCWLLALSFLLRAAAGWSAWAGWVANLSGAAVMALYIPVLMSMIYDRAKRSGAAFQFHFGAEAGWDTGAVLGSLAAAWVAWMCPAMPSLAVLPGGLGVALVWWCIRADEGLGGLRWGAEGRKKAVLF